MSNHYKEKCQYGFMHRQCRCPGGTLTIKACTKPDAHAKVLRDAFQWCAIHQVHIMDPDGWRHGDGVDLDTPITFDDFKNRLGESTARALDKDFFNW